MKVKQLINKLNNENPESQICFIVDSEITNGMEYKEMLSIDMDYLGERIYYLNEDGSVSSENIDNVRQVKIKAVYIKINP
jgi:hypothetical protein